MSELIGAWILLAGTLLVAGALLGLVVRAFQTRVLLGFLTLLTFPLGPVVFGILYFGKVRGLMLLLVFGILLGGVPFAAQLGQEAIFGLGERERIVDGERYLVLTGWDREGYSILQEKPDIVVLEMGNPNVTDETLLLLAPLEKLRELTLNDTAITDAGLGALRKLPSLETLRLARTKITAAGVKAFLADPPARLLNIDVTGNQIPASALRKWRNADPEKRRYLN